jgi:predicted ester cyclase
MTTASDLQANKDLAVGWLLNLNQGRIDQMLATTADDWQMHGGPPALPTGRAGVLALLEHIGPIDQTWSIADVIAEGDRVVVRAVNTCVQDSFLGLPAAHVRQVFTATFTFRIVDGMVHEIWRNADDLGRVLQLGATLLPPDRTPA